MFTFPPPAHAFKALLPNLAGTDFFVGDIHGTFQRLSQALEQVGFDVSKDRLICVGDLLDRGPDSDVAMEWLTQPFFHTVRGNHEDLYMHWRARRHDRSAQATFEEEVYFRNGGSWVRNLSESDHHLLEALIRELPYFLAVPTPDGRTVGVVHAELPDQASWPGLLMTPAQDRSTLFRTMTWGRERLKQARLREQDTYDYSKTPITDDNQIFGLDLVVCGHVVVRSPRPLGNIVYLDTGGWRPQGRFSIMRLPDLLSLIRQDYLLETD